MPIKGIVKSANSFPQTTPPKHKEKERIFFTPPLILRIGKVH